MWSAREVMDDLQMIDRQKTREPIEKEREEREIHHDIRIGKIALALERLLHLPSLDIRI